MDAILGSNDEAAAALPRSIVLPEIEFVRKFRLGRQVCLLRESQSVDVVRITSELAYGRTRFPVWHLGTGDRITVVDRKLRSIPAGITGVLERTDEGHQWQWHSLVDDFEARVKADAGAVAAEIEAAWKDKFRFRMEEADSSGEVAPGNEGLRPPQIGALHAIGAHWSIFPNEVATVVMPTGTGKTETMLGTVVNYRRGPTLVVVPSRALRNQTFGKFRKLGLLRDLGLVDRAIPNPIVGVITKEPNCEEDFEMLRGCNVVIAVMASLGAPGVAPFRPGIAAIFASLFVDEAHHIPSDTWSEFRSHFTAHRIVQFTATPFRLDRKLVDGRVIFNYSLAAAQRDRYFKKITFLPVFELDQADADEAIAREAVRVLRTDLRAGLRHLLMARCRLIDRGAKIKAIYDRLAPEFDALVVHSDMEDSVIEAAIARMRAGESKIVICVNMLGEGFDLPELKIAALHDLHKSLPILLQFTGRFTRTSAVAIGDATVVANIADPKVSQRLEKLYTENADWNVLLSERSSEAAKEHAELVEFLRNSDTLVDDSGVDEIKISKNLLRPKFSTIVFRCTKFTPKSFQKGISSSVIVHNAWLNPSANLLFFVSRRQDAVRWAKGRVVEDREWHLFVLYHDAEAGLLHINSSDKASTHDELAKAVGADSRIQGETVFRSLGGINRLIFSNIGVRKHGRRNMSFAMYTGADVKEALTAVDTKDATKSNLDGRGWEYGSVVHPGCSAKGRVWSKAQGSIPHLVRWCRPVGRKLIDETIDASKIIDNVLIPVEVKDKFPEEQVLSVEWPPELLKTSDERIFVVKGDQEVATAFCEWSFDEENSTATKLAFRLISSSGELDEQVSLKLDASKGYRFEGAPGVSFKSGRLTMALTDYLYNYPLLVRYVSLKELEGDLLYEQSNPATIKLDDRSLESWKWPKDKVDITVESIWKKGVERPKSVQAYVAAHYRDEGFEVVFNDDDAGEAADLVCLKEEEESVRIVLTHCKFSGGATEGTRVKDVVEVTSQAVRSAIWRGNFDRLHRHLLARLKLKGSGAGSRSRFLTGSLTTLAAIAKSTRIKPIDFDIVIVQPGVSRSRMSEDQRLVLGAGLVFLKQTIGVDARVICSE
ncbi:DEAD/DEAH box helicase [Bradyrhizobium sp. CCBAU 53338]|uniref:DEAD/DEAH box helicase n=1 Tax=Bradyrhizobium sp. CCBAU 53338 TaxID=1325111 RepID=UPI00188A4573|nr:DEAD/DEAH box helicase family protein [Bradyrhizobium sp. CCBAU 53338]QOZ51547.1 type III restriction endonuclease subunit R [Bradyrhizobium sp. CCBAU 53338]